jgi:hypothetical protein
MKIQVIFIMLKKDQSWKRFPTFDVLATEMGITTNLAQCM